MKRIEIAVRRFHDATIGVLRELERLFPVDASVVVKLSARQKRWSPAVVIGHNTHHGGANIQCRLTHAKKWNHRAVRTIGYKDVKIIFGGE